MPQSICVCVALVVSNESTYAIVCGPCTPVVVTRLPSQIEEALSLERAAAAAASEVELLSKEEVRSVVTPCRDALS